MLLRPVCNFAREKKRLLVLSCLFVRLEQLSSDFTEVLKSDILGFLVNLSIKFEFH